MSAEGDDCLCAPVKVRRVSHSFGNVEALRDVSLEVAKGDLVAIVGPNGGGKSTLVKVMLGLLSPHDGSAELFCQSAARFREWRKVAHVPQHATAFDAQFPIKVAELVLLGRIPNRRLGRRFSREDREAARWAMDVCDVGPLAGRRVGDLSGGQKQRVLIAKALARKPELLLMDEPTTGVDAQSQDRLFEILDRMNAEFGTTVVIVTHDHSVLHERVQRVVALSVSILFQGTPADYAEFEHRAQPRRSTRPAARTSGG
jgi:zinc transport system ATP-binding protein